MPVAWDPPWSAAHRQAGGAPISCPYPAAAVRKPGDGTSTLNERAENPVGAVNAKCQQCEKSNNPHHLLRPRPGLLPNKLVAEAVDDPSDQTSEPSERGLKVSGPKVTTVNLRAERDSRTGKPTQGPAGPIVGTCSVVKSGHKQMVGTDPSFWHQSHTGAHLV